MPKDNEVDEKVIARYVWTNAGMKGGEPQWAGNWVRYDDHAATVAELRAEVEMLRSGLLRIESLLGPRVHLYDTTSDMALALEAATSTLTGADPT